MIVILIILLLTQVGNIGALFRQKDRSQWEEIMVQLLGLVDEEKINALLGKTHQSDTSVEIVRKRSVQILVNNDEHRLSFVSLINLAKEAEHIFENRPIQEKSWTLPQLTWSWYWCDSSTWESAKIETSGMQIDFSSDKISLYSLDETKNTSSLNTSHIALKITNNDASQEIHIDRRTWLTYIRPGTTQDTIFCH
jgi:hypothetical protein